MIVKTSIRFLSKDSDVQLVSKTATILASLTANAHYTAPSPTLAEVSDAKTSFLKALSDAADGGKTLTAIKNAKRVLLVDLLRQLGSYIQVTAKGDLTVLLSSGFPIHKPQRNPASDLPAPTILAVEFGSRKGELRAYASPVTGVAIYNWRVTTPALPEVAVQIAQSTAANCTFANLTPGLVYHIEANAVGSTGAGDWSNPVAQMAV